MIMEQHRILVVDDEPIIRATVADSLSADGFAVDIAADGAEAIRRFRETAPDLVLLDVMLPGISGVEVCRVIRSESSVPIILLTARDSEADKVLGLEVGADDYVTKPFSMRELSARVRSNLRRMNKKTSGDLQIVRVGRVDVDLAGHRLLRDGRVLPVKPRAFLLLAFLLQHRGQVFSREHLLQRVWGTDFPGETRTVDVHVHALRELIEERPAEPEILQTVRGTGYVLRSET